MEVKKKKLNILFYVNFVVATIAITELFTSNKYFAVGNDEKGYLVAGISFLVFIASLFMMAYQIYSEEKEKNNLRVSFRPFDLIYKQMSDNNRHPEPERRGIQWISDADALDPLVISLSQDDKGASLV